MYVSIIIISLVNFVHVECRYVLLKERNMLLTLRHEANRNRFIMPAPERLRKVSVFLY